MRLYYDMAEFRNRLQKELFDETYPELSTVQELGIEVRDVLKIFSSKPLPQIQPSLQSLLYVKSMISIRLLLKDSYWQIKRIRTPARTLTGRSSKPLPQIQPTPGIEYI